jgi:membrane-bound lytic murein transglycosylase B
MQRRVLGFCLTMLFCFTAFADQSLLHKKSVDVFIHQMVNQYHFDKRQLRNILLAARFQPKIIESMERPYEKKTWDVYQELFITPLRVQSGVEFWKSHRAELAKAEQQFGVSAAMIVAIIGIETLYGKNQGNYRVLDALTTLAFYYPARSEFFTKELKEFLLLCREHGVWATKYMGSYAGAMGKPQFMPSSYRAYALNQRGKRQTDLMNNDRDVIVSVANYFHQHGWKANAPVAQPVTMSPYALKRINMAKKYASYSMSTLLSSGVKPHGAYDKNSFAGVIELITKHGQEYWLAYPNFYVITRYNSSPQYALAALLLSEKISKNMQSK